MHFVTVAALVAEVAGAETAAAAAAVVVAAAAGKSAQGHPLEGCLRGVGCA